MCAVLRSWFTGGRVTRVPIVPARVRRAPGSTLCGTFRSGAWTLALAVVVGTLIVGALAAGALVGGSPPVLAQGNTAQGNTAQGNTTSAQRLPLEELLGYPIATDPAAAATAGSGSGNDATPALPEASPPPSAGAEPAWLFPAEPRAATGADQPAEPSPAFAAPTPTPTPGSATAAPSPLATPEAAQPSGTSEPAQSSAPAAGAAPASGTAPATAPVIGTAPTDGTAYVLSPGDVVFVSVWREEQLQRELVVLPDGTISFPLAGRVEVARKTTEEVEQILAMRLKKYIPDAAVSVSVVAASGYRVYVVGAVNKPGEFQVPRRITVMQALSLAGGLTPFAGEDSIRIIRRDHDRTVAIPFAYSDVKRGRNIETDIELKSGDTVVVAGESLF